MKTITEMRELMSDISESTYCAGWIGDLEFNLWEIVFEGKPKSHWSITDEEIEELEQLAKHYNGWWIFNSRKKQLREPVPGKGFVFDAVCDCYEGPAFITLDRFKEYKKKHWNSKQHVQPQKLDAEHVRQALVNCYEFAGGDETTCKMLLKELKLR